MWAKVSPPILPDIIDRQRLHPRLRPGLQERVTWVGAPAGSGKTVLVASHVRRGDVPCLWYRVDEGDNDPGTVFAWLRRAAAHLMPVAALAELPAFTPEKTPDLNEFGRGFIRALLEALPTRCVLVFDNVQKANDDAYFHALIRTGIEELAAGQHVVMISRTDPHRLLAAFSAARQLTFLNWSDLRFTDEEARELVTLLTEGSRTDEAARLQAMADGWAVGLTLLSRQRARTSREPAVEGKRLPSVLFDYFATELFEELDPELQRFLLCTAMPPVLTVTMAASLSARADAGDILATLHRRNLFLLRREEAEPSYEYHALFRGFLAQRLCASWPPAEVLALKQATAQALARGGDREAAADLFVELGDWAAIERLLQDYGDELVSQARHGTLARWLKGCPAATLAARPWLRYWQSVSWTTTSVPLAIAGLTDSYRAFRARGDLEAAFEVWATAVEFLANINSYGAELDFWLDEMDALHAAGHAPARDDLACLVAANMSSAVEYRRPWHADAEYWRLRALNLAREANRHDLRIQTHLHWLQTLLFTGSDEVQTTLDVIDRLASSYEIAPPHQLLQKFAHAGVATIQGRHEEAVGMAIDSLGFLKEHNLVIFKPVILYELARTYQNIGSFSESSALVNELALLRPALGPVGAFWYSGIKAVDDFMRGDASSAARLMDAATDYVGREGLTWAHAVIYFVRAQALSQIGQHEPAARDIARLTEMARCMNNRLLRHHCLLAEAELALNRGEEAAALAALRQGLALAPSVPLCHAYPWRPAVLARLMAMALAHGIEPEGAAKIIRERGLTPPAGETVPALWPRRYHVKMFGQFSLTRDGACIPGTRSTKLALLQSVIWHGGRNVSVDVIADDLWPEKDGDRAENTLQVTILRLRELIGDKSAIRVANRAVSLDPSLWRCDVDEFRAIIDAIHGVARRLRGEADTRQVLRLQHRLLELYREDLLVDAGDALWVRSARRKTKEVFIRALDNLCSIWERAGEPEKADVCRRRAREARSMLG